MLVANIWTNPRTYCEHFEQFYKCVIRRKSISTLLVQRLQPESHLSSVTENQKINMFGFF